MFPPPGNNNDDGYGPPHEEPGGYVDPDPDLMNFWNAAAADLNTDDYNNYYWHHQLGQGQTSLLLHTPSPSPTPTTTSVFAAAGSSGAGGHPDAAQQDDKKKKKEVAKMVENRKEIERERRKHMSTLHSSLISLLPHNTLKGKQSMSDHMGEAVTYIKHLESNIGELSTKRDKLLKGSSALSVDHHLTNDSASSSSGVTLRPHSAGVEVVISSGGGGFELSRVVEALIEQGFDVTSCISTQRHGRFYNTMQCHPGSAAMSYIDLPGLQRKLNHVLSYNK